jgi:hypothetical protein
MRPVAPKESTQMPRDVKIIKNFLAELAKAKAVTDQYPRTDLATKMFLESMDAHEERLKEELKAALWLEAQSDLELSLSGSSVKEHSLEVDILTRFLRLVQNIWFSMAESITGSEISRTGFSNNLIEENALFVKGFFPSSFTIHLSYSEKHALQSTPIDDNNTNAKAEDALLSLLTGYGKEFESQALSQSPELRRHYINLLTFLTDNNLCVAARTRKHPFAVKMTAKEAEERKSILNTTHDDYKNTNTAERVVIEGILVMYDMSKQRFKISDEKVTYRGFVSAEATEDLRKLALGSKVKAELLVTTDNKHSKRPNYTLLSLRNAGQRSWE